MSCKYNYAAASLNTQLNEKVIVESAQLQSLIEAMPPMNMYHGYYDLEKRDNFVAYEGLMMPVFDTVHLDFDSEDGGGAAWKDVYALGKKLREANINFQLYFSGNKGFHLAIHASRFGITDPLPKPEMEAKIKSIALTLKPDYPTIDTGIWNANRKFRAYRSLHEKSGLYKITLLGLGLEISKLTIEEIRELAKVQQKLPYVHPTKGQPDPWLVSLTANVEAKTYTPNNTATKELPQGTMEEDSTSRFSTFHGKKCIAAMWEKNLPQFNRHDIGLRLIHDLFSTGVSESDARKRMKAWAERTFGVSAERNADIDRQITDAYHKPQTYRFGCFDPVKQAYCSAKCKIYNQIDPRKRARPVDCSKNQATENTLSESPAAGFTEGQIADNILSEMGEVVLCSGDFFKWETTHWNRIDRDRMVHSIKQCCIAAYANAALFAKVESLYKHILAKIPVAPEKNHFFACAPDKFNFTDGTVHVHKDLKGKVTLELKPHVKEDYLAHCHPFPFSGESGLQTSGDFAHYVQTRSETLGPDGLLALKQLFGAALIPYSPRIFFLLGESNTGKSTAAVILENLLGASNVSSVDPTSDYQFAWEPAIGKIANICRELPPRKPIQDDKLKEIRDKRPVGVQRKGIKGVTATLPFLHVYCCNKMPPSLEGNTGALDHRITILRFKPAEVNGFGHIAELGDFMWSQDPGGILEFARDGLKSLVESNFKYERVAESTRILTEWQDETDPVKAFVQEVSAGQIRFLIDDEGFKRSEGALLGKKVYKQFVDWARESGFYPMSVKKFYSELERCGVRRGPKSEFGQTVSFPASDRIQTTNAPC